MLSGEYDPASHDKMSAEVLGEEYDQALDAEGDEAADAECDAISKEIEEDLKESSAEKNLLEKSSKQEEIQADEEQQQEQKPGGGEGLWFMCDGVCGKPILPGKKFFESKNGVCLSQKCYRDAAC